MKQGPGGGSWLTDLAEEEPEAAALLGLRSEDIPDPTPWLDWLWEAWNRLRDEAQPEVMGLVAPMGGTMIVSKPRRIPWTAMKAWSEDHDYSIEDREMLERCLTEMDAEYLVWWDEREQARAAG